MRSPSFVLYFSKPNNSPRLCQNVINRWTWIWFFWLSLVKQKFSAERRHNNWTVYDPTRAHQVQIFLSGCFHFLSLQNAWNLTENNSKELPLPVTLINSVLVILFKLSSQLRQTWRCHFDFLSAQSKTRFDLKKVFRPIAKNSKKSPRQHLLCRRALLSQCRWLGSDVSAWLRQLVGLLSGLLLGPGFFNYLQHNQGPIGLTLLRIACSLLR